MCPDQGNMQNDIIFTNARSNGPNVKICSAAAVVTPNGHVVAQEDIEGDQYNTIDLMDSCYKTPTKQRKHLKKKLF